MSRKPMAVSLDANPAKTKSPKASSRRTPRVMKAPKVEDTIDVFDPASADYVEEMPSHLPPHRSGRRWGVLLFACFTALVSLGLGLWVTSVVEGLFARSEWLGWIASGLVGVAVFALFFLTVREIAALLRLKTLGRLREEVQRAMEGSNSSAESAIQSIVRLYQNREDMTWGLSRLASETDGIMDGHDRLLVAERTLMKPLDDEAKAMIAGAAKRIAVVTAVNPAPSLDVLFTGYQILRMLRQITNLYGSRPGSIGTLKLARMVGTHLALTGGLALSDTLIQQFVGKGLAGRLSAKLGEGTVNGILTARIGLAAIELCRPMPFKSLDKPGLREFLTVIAGANESKKG